MSKPNWMTDEVFELLQRAIEGLDTASNAIDDAIWELDDIDTNYLYGSLQTLDNYIGNFARQLVLYSTDIWKE